MRDRRKQCLKLSVMAIVFFLVVMLGTAFTSYLVKPYYQVAASSPFVKVPGFGSLPTGQPEKLGFNTVEADGFLQQTVYHDVWVIKQSPDSATVFSPICPHLGCHYKWVAAMQKFLCPCHGSIFSKLGKVLGGPAPRPLDTLPCKIKNGELYVQWETFVPGIPKRELQ